MTSPDFEQFWFLLEADFERVLDPGSAAGREAAFIRQINQRGDNAGDGLERVGQSSEDGNRAD